MRLMRSTALAAAVALAGAASVAKGSCGPAGAVFPSAELSRRPYAAGGTGFFGGFIDYMNLINMRDGGVNGVKLTWRRMRDAIYRGTWRRML